jgi:hypothetical protein
LGADPTKDRSALGAGHLDGVLLSSLYFSQNSVEWNGGVVGMWLSGGDPATECSKHSDNGGVWWRKTVSSCNSGTKVELAVKRVEETSKKSSLVIGS